jgi:hypothetical protein
MAFAVANTEDNVKPYFFIPGNSLVSKSSTNWRKIVLPWQVLNFA